MELVAWSVDGLAGELGWTHKNCIANIQIFQSAPEAAHFLKFQASSLASLRSLLMRRMMNSISSELMKPQYFLFTARSGKSTRKAKPRKPAATVMRPKTRKIHLQPSRPPCPSCVGSQCSSCRLLGLRATTHQLHQTKCEDARTAGGNQPEGVEASVPFLHVVARIPSRDQINHTGKVAGLEDTENESQRNELPPLGDECKADLLSHISWPCSESRAQF